MVDVSDGRYATQAGRQKQSQPSAKSCYEGRSQIVQNPSPMGRKTYVQLPLRDVTPKTLTDEDRKYLMGNTSVQGVRLQVEPVHPSGKQTVRPLQQPTDEDRQYWMGPNVVAGIQIPNKQQMAKDGARDVEAQKITGRRLGLEPLMVTVPRAMLEQESFIVELPEGVAPEDVEFVVDDGDVDTLASAQNAPRLRLDPNANDTLNQFRGRQLANDQIMQETRDYYKSGKFVQGKKAVTFLSKNE